PGWVTEDVGHGADAVGAAVGATGPAAAAAPVSIGTGRSGTTLLTAGLCCSRATSAAGSLAAMPLTLISCVMLVPPWALIEAMIGAWSCLDAAIRSLACLTRLRSECWFLSTTMTLLLLPAAVA